MALFLLRRTGSCRNDATLCDGAPCCPILTWISLQRTPSSRPRAERPAEGDTARHSWNSAAASVTLVLFMPLISALSFASFLFLSFRLRLRGFARAVHQYRCGRDQWCVMVLSPRADSLRDLAGYMFFGVCCVCFFVFWGVGVSTPLFHLLRWLHQVCS